MFGNEKKSLHILLMDPRIDDDFLDTFKLCLLKEIVKLNVVPKDVQLLDEAKYYQVQYLDNNITLHLSLFNNNLFFLHHNDNRFKSFCNKAESEDDLY